MNSVILFTNSWFLSLDRGGLRLVRLSVCGRSRGGIVSLNVHRGASKVAGFFYLLGVVWAWRNLVEESSYNSQCSSPFPI